MTAAKTKTHKAIDFKLEHHAMLLKVEFSIWIANKKDDAISEQIAADHGADKRMGNFRKHLMPPGALDEVRSIKSQAKSDLYKRTNPWLDEGVRIFASPALFDIVKRVDYWHGQWNGGVDRFIEAYAGKKLEAQQRLGTLYCEKDYPSEAELRSKFRFDCSPLPVPQGDHLIGRLVGGQLDLAMERINARTEQGIEDGMKHAYGEVAGAITKIMTKLRNYKPSDDDGKAAGVFRDTLVSNVEAVLDLVPMLNITGDERLQKVADEARAELCAFTCEQLRESPELRISTAAKAEALLKQVEGYF